MKQKTAPPINTMFSRSDFGSRWVWNLCPGPPWFHVSSSEHAKTSDHCPDPNRGPHCAPCRPTDSSGQHTARLSNCPMCSSLECLQGNNNWHLLFMRKVELQFRCVCVYVTSEWPTGIPLHTLYRSNIDDIIQTISFTNMHHICRQWFPYVKSQLIYGSILACVLMQCTWKIALTTGATITFERYIVHTFGIDDNCAHDALMRCYPLQSLLNFLWLSMRNEKSIHISIWTSDIY